MTEASAEGNLRAPVPVLILGGGVTALGTIRSLGPLGIPVFVSCSPSDFAAHSRWARVLAGGVPEFSSIERLAEYLRNAPADRMVLIPCSDTWAETVASLPSAVAERFPSFVSPLEVLRRLTDKEKFAGLVREHDIPHPHTLFMDDVSGLSSLDDSPGKQYFLKARNSQQFIARTGVKAYMVSSLDEVHRRITELSAAGLSVILQEYVPGPPSNHYFVDGFIDRDGVIRARFARQRLRMYPPHFGNSTYLRSVALTDVPDIVATVDHLILASGLRGIFSVELKRDQTTGIAKVLEVNARAWWYVGYATTCGVNVCEMTYRAALGEPLPAFDGAYTVDRTCAFVRPDYRASRELRRTGQLSLATCIWQWLRAEHMLASWSDPMPAAHQFIDQANLTIRRLWRN